MIVISNTSPIINLAAIGKLDLLRKRFGKIIIPNGVFEEIAITGSGQPGAEEVNTFEWIEVVQVEECPLLTLLRGELDKGEAETIALGVELKADLMLLDERLARDIASRLKVPFIGLLAVLVDAKNHGYIPAVKPLMDDLINKGFWINKKLYNRISDSVKE